MPRRLPLWVLVVVAGLAGWLFWPALAGSGTFVFRDGAHYFPPLFGFNVEEWRAGRVPLWNPYEQIGLPALAENTASVFYPGQLLLLLPVDFFWAYNLYVVSHVAIAALGAFRLARQWGGSILGAGLAAVAFAFSGSVLFQYCNVVFLVGAAWLPFALAATDRLLRGRQAGDAALLGLFWALMVLGGDPQMAYHAALLAAAYACYLTYTARHIPEILPATSGRRWQHAVITGRFGRLALAGGIAFGLAAVQILPTWELAGLGPRVRHDLPRSLWEWIAWREPADVGEKPAPHPAPSALAAMLDASKGGDHLPASYQFSVGPWRWLELIWPNVSGRQFPTHRRWLSALACEGRIWTPSLYSGAVVLLLALGGWRLRKRDGRLRCVGWMTLWAMLGGVGEYGLGWGVHQTLSVAFPGWDDQSALAVGPEFGGVYWLMNLLFPGYVAFRYPAKLWTIAALGISLLAARGWDAAWSDGATAAARRCRRLALASGCGVLGVLLGRGWLLEWFAAAPADPLLGPLDGPGAWQDILMSFAQTGFVCVIAAWLLRTAGPARAAWAPLALLVLLAVDLGIAHRWLVPCIDVAEWRRMPALAARILTGSAGALKSPPRMYRDRHWLPPAWEQSGNAERLDEMFRWDRDTLWPKYHLPLHIGSVKSSGMLIPDDYLALWDVARRRPLGPLPDQSILDLVGADYAIWAMDNPVPDARADGDNVAALSAANAQWGRNGSALPRAWIVHRVEELPPLLDTGPSQLRRRTEEVLFPANGSRDWRHEAVVESAAPLPRSPAPALAESVVPGEEETCQVKLYEPQRVMLDVRLIKPGLVVLADMFYPGWRVTVDDGSDAATGEILRTNRVLRGVWLPAGEFRLEFRFEPPLFRRGAVISGAAWLGLVMALVWLLRRRDNKPDS